MRLRNTSAPAVSMRCLHSGGSRKMRKVLNSSMLLATICGLLGGCGGSGSGASVMSFSGTLGSCITSGDVANCDEATYTAMGSTDPAMALRSVDQAGCTPGSTYTAGQLCP